jgi:hypothetical protein
VPGGVAILANSAVMAEAAQLLKPDQFRRALFQTVQRTTREGQTDVRKELKSQLNLTQKYISRVITSRLVIHDPAPPEGKITVKHEGLPLIAFSPRVSKRGGVTAVITKGGQPLRFGHGFKAAMKSGHVGVYIRERLPVFSAQTKAEDLIKAGFPEHEARELLGGHELRSVVDNRVLGIASPKPHVPELFGRGIRYQRRVATGGNFPSVNAKGIAGRLPIKELRGPSVESVAELKDVSARIENALEARLEKNLKSQIDRFTK